MIYVYIVVFTIFSIINLIRGIKVRIRTVFNKMDFISIVFLWVLFILLGYFFKSDFKKVLVMAIVASFYLLTSKYARGVTEEGIIVQSKSFMVKEYGFSEIKEIDISDDGQLLMLSIVLKSKDTDVQRYPIARRRELLNILEDNNVFITYK